jgi:tetraacyldisaccharide 4'-kinase
VTSRVVQWLWASRSGAARTARALLLPPAAVYAALARVRAHAYRRGWARRHALPLPAVAVGNLALGGTGKTPLAAWIAAFYARNGMRPGVLLRGHGGDEQLVHQHLVPTAIVVPDPDRVAGAARARAEGARVLVLDDAFQHLRVRRDLDVVVVATEQEAAPPWPVPAGPWRERKAALGRADLIVVTRRRAPADQAAAVADTLRQRFPGTPVAIARLAIARLEGRRSGAAQFPASLDGRRVVAAAGVGAPDSFAAQLRAAGAAVDLVAFGDHHAYTAADVTALLRAAAAVDYVVITEKDAVKLRARWPDEAPEPLVAVLEVEWERNGEAVERALSAVTAVVAGAR